MPKHHLILPIVGIGLFLSASSGYSAEVLVPPHIAERATSIALTHGGEGTTINRISRLPDRPGLTHVTKVEYTMPSGQKDTLIMLPDGATYFPAGLETWSSQDDSQSISPKEGPRYRPNDILEKSDFRTDVVDQLFSGADNIPEIYFNIVEDAIAVTEGTSNNHIYVMFDPACTYCRAKNSKLKPLIDAGKITVHWIPVIGPSRPPYGALLSLIDAATPNEVRASRLNRYASGNTQANKVEIAKPDVAFEALTKTTGLLNMLREQNDELRAAGTPQAFYRLSDGRIRHHYGYNEFQIRQIRQDFSF